MSMKNWACYGAGLVLTDTEIQPFVESKGFEDPWEYVDAAEDEISGGDIFPGAAYFGDDVNGQEFHDLYGELTEPVETLVFWAKSQPDLFNAAYESKEQLVEEFKSRFAGLFESDEEWYSHIGEFSCVVWS